MKKTYKLVTKSYEESERKLNDIRMQIQMHKIIWSPETKGV